MFRLLGGCLFLHVSAICTVFKCSPILRLKRTKCRSVPGKGDGCTVFRHVLKAQIARKWPENWGDLWHHPGHLDPRPCRKRLRPGQKHAMDSCAGPCLRWSPSQTPNARVGPCWQPAVAGPKRTPHDALRNKKRRGRGVGIGKKCNPGRTRKFLAPQVDEEKESLDIFLEWSCQELQITFEFGVFYLYFQLIIRWSTVDRNLHINPTGVGLFNVRHSYLGMGQEFKNVQDLQNNKCLSCGEPSPLTFMLGLLAHTLRTDLTVRILWRSRPDWNQLQQLILRFTKEDASQVERDSQDSTEESTSLSNPPQPCSNADNLYVLEPPIFFPVSWCLLIIVLVSQPSP